MAFTGGYVYVCHHPDWILPEVFLQHIHDRLETAVKRFKDKDATLTGKALEQYYRKHKNIQQLAETLMKINEIDPRNKSKPLSDQEIEELAGYCWMTDEDLQIFNYKQFAKLLQERHGIK